MSAREPRPVARLVTVRAIPGQADAVADVIRAAVDATRAEPGCLRHDVYRDAADTASFTVVEHWSSRAALGAHVEEPHHREAMARLEPLLASAPSVSVLREVRPQRGRREAVSLGGVFTV